MAKDTKKPPANQPPAMLNKKARHEFEILAKVEAGISLKGTEVKSIRQGGASLTEAYARIDAGQIRLINFQIQPYKEGNRYNHDPKRPKQLLLHKREIKKLTAAVQIKGQTLIPLSIYFNKDGLLKVELALARGKTHRDKRQDERKKEDSREIRRAQRRGGM